MTNERIKQSLKEHNFSDYQIKQVFKALKKHLPKEKECLSSTKIVPCPCPNCKPENKAIEKLKTNCWTLERIELADKLNEIIDHLNKVNRF